jgi:hypothetical protein
LHGGAEPADGIQTPSPVGLAAEQLYSQMYAGTRQVLPPHGDNPRPNLLHLYFHVLFLINLALATILWLSIA